jgi:hypothetical protein
MRNLTGGSEKREEVASRKFGNDWTRSEELGKAVFGSGTMTKVILDDAALSKISDLNEYTELCDKDGKTVGYFFPVVEQESDPNAGIEPPVSDEELQRRKHEPTSSLADIWQRIDPK